MKPLIKQPGESLLYNLPMGDLGGAAISGIVSVTVTARGLVPEISALQIVGEVFSGSVVQFRAQGGTDGEQYLITVRAQTDAADVVEAEGELYVIDLAWTLPAEQGGSYASPQAYVTRYGLAEAERLTDETGTGRIDKDALMTALRDASAEIDGYLARRYLTPLAPVPQLIANLCAEIARYKLHGDGAPDLVVTRYRDAIKTLTLMAQSTMVLGGAAAAAGASSSGLPMVSAPPPTFDDSGLGGW